MKSKIISPLFHYFLWFKGIFAWKYSKWRIKLIFQLKMVNLCTRIPNLRLNISNFLQKSQESFRIWYNWSLKLAKIQVFCLSVLIRTKIVKNAPLCSPQFTSSSSRLQFFQELRNSTLLVFFSFLSEKIFSYCEWPKVTHSKRKNLITPKKEKKMNR